MLAENCNLIVHTINDKKIQFTRLEFVVQDYVAFSYTIDQVDPTVEPSQQCCVLYICMKQNT